MSPLWKIVWEELAWLTPEGHEDCIEDCSGMVKQVGNFRVGTNLKGSIYVMLYFLHRDEYLM